MKRPVCRLVTHEDWQIENIPLSSHWWSMVTGTQTRTGRIEKIRQMHPQPFLRFILDAANLGIQDQDWEDRAASPVSRSQ